MATQYFKDSGVKTEICEKIYHLLDQFIEVAITFRNCLEVLYEKIGILRSRLEDIRNKIELSGLRKQLQNRMY
jgi:hypothetical protein